VADGKLSEFEGDLDDYKQWARNYATQHQKAKPKETRGVSGEIGLETAPVLESGNTDRKAQKRAEAEARQKNSAVRKPMEQKLAALETELKGLTTERDNIEQWLSNETAYAEENKTRLQEMLKRQGEVVTLISDVEWKWFELQQKLEEMNAA